MAGRKKGRNRKFSESDDRVYGVYCGAQDVERLEDTEFVFVSFWRHVNVVDYRHACVDEEQGEGGEAGRENDA